MKFLIVFAALPTILIKQTTSRSFTFYPKYTKVFASVPGRPSFSNCGTPIEKVSEYLDFLLRPVIKDSWSYIKDIGNFLKKLNV